MNFMSYEFNPKNNKDAEVVAPRITRLSPLEDAKLRIKSLESKPRCSIESELIVNEIFNITDLYQTGTIAKIDYSNLLDQLINLRNESGMHSRDGQAARDQFDRYGV